MTWYEALHKFFNGFGLSAYPIGAVPDDAVLPYITYERRIGDSAEITVHIYYYTESEKLPSEKAEEICDMIRPGGIQLQFDKGTVWIKTSSPEWYSVDGDSGSNPINRDFKHIVVNLTTDFILTR